MGYFFVCYFDRRLANYFQKTNSFCKELKKVIPNSVIKYRRGLDLKKIVPQAIERDFTDLIVINEDAGEPSILSQNL